MSDDKKLAETLAALVEGMREYMGDGDAAYDANDIAECEAILTEHANVIARVGDREAALEKVRATVLKLNALNERCEGELIETDQREDICAFIIRVGYLRGFNDENEDVTEVWRDW